MLLAAVNMRSLGPIIGGALADSSATWRWAFYLNLCVGAVVAPVFIFLLPSHNPGKQASVLGRLRTLDWLGAILNAGALISLVMGISFGGGVFPWKSRQIIGLFVCSGVLWTLFFFQQAFALWTTEENRLFPVRYLRSKEMTLLFLQIVSAGIPVYIPLYFVPLYFQFVRSDTSLAAAKRLLPLVFFQVAGVILTGALISKVAYYMMIFLAGGILSLIGGTLLYLVKIDTSAGAIYGYSILVGLGSGLYIQAAYPVAQLKVDPSEIPRVVAFIGYGNIIGITLALTLSGSIFLNEATNRISSVLPLVPRLAIQQAITGARGTFFHTIDPVEQKAVLEAIVRSVGNVYIVVIVSSAVSIIVSVFMKREKLPKKGPEGQDSGIVLDENAGHV